MSTENDNNKALQEIIDDLRCPKEFKCYTSGLQKLCKSRDVGLESVLLCLEEKAKECTFSVQFGDDYFCYCPLRVYIAKKLKK